MTSNDFWKLGFEVSEVDMCKVCERAGWQRVLQ